MIRIKFCPRLLLTTVDVFGSPDMILDTILIITCVIL